MRVLGNTQIKIVIIVLFAFLILPSYGKYGGGTGEPNDPYLLYTTEHLNTINSEPNDSDKHFKVMSCIDLSGTTYSDALIPSFDGIFDGNYMTISNLTITGQSNLGLFGRLNPGAEINNLSITNVNIVGLGNYVGGLAGENNGNITYCCSTGVVNGIECVGGLVGCNTQYGNITSSHSSVKVSGNWHLGGLVGSNSGIVINCYSNGPVNGIGDIGGLTGFGSLQSGDLLEDNIRGVVIGSFWDIETSGCIYSDGGTGKTTAEMLDPNTYKDSGWDFMDETANGTDDSWWIDEGQDYPKLFWESIEDDSYFEETNLAENEAADAGLASEDDNSDIIERFTERFTSASDAFDLAYKSITFTPTTDGSFYNATIQEITELPTNPVGGTHLYLGDDSYMFIDLSDQKRVYIYGFSYVRFYVGSNGYLTFTRGDTVGFNNLYNQFNTKRVSCFFQDLDPSRGGMVRWKQFSDRVAVTWENIHEYCSSNSNSFQVEMYFDGRIRISWLEIDTETAVVGLSRGLGVPDNFQEIDFSELSSSSSTPTPGDDPPVSPTGRKDRRK